MIKTLKEEAANGYYATDDFVQAKLDESIIAHNELEKRVDEITCGVPLESTTAEPSLQVGDKVRTIETGVIMGIDLENNEVDVRIDGVDLIYSLSKLEKVK